MKEFLKWTETLVIGDIIEYQGKGKHWSYILREEAKRMISAGGNKVKLIKPSGYEITIFRSITGLHSRRSWVPSLDIAKDYCQKLEDWRNNR